MSGRILKSFPGPDFGRILSGNAFAEIRPGSQISGPEAPTQVARIGGGQLNLRSKRKSCMLRSRWRSWGPWGPRVGPPGISKYRTSVTHRAPRSRAAWGPWGPRVWPPGISKYQISVTHRAPRSRAALHGGPCMGPRVHGAARNSKIYRISVTHRAPRSGSAPRHRVVCRSPPHRLSPR